MAESLGTAYVDIEPRIDGFGSEAEKQITKELAPAKKAIDKDVGDSMSGAFKKVGTAIAAAGIGAFLKSAVGAAGDLGEQVSKVSTVFGPAADKVEAFGDSATESIGASRLEALEAAGTFGNLLTAVGLSQDAAADMSVEMIQLAGDLASFNNVPVADALAAIRSGLVGETEPLKAFGVNMNEAALKAEAMRLGLDTSGTSLSATTKAQAAYSLIMQQTSVAQGDFARTSDSAANQQRIFAAELENAKAEIGEAMLPAMKSLIGVGRDLIPVFQSVAGTVGEIAAAAAIAIGPIAGFVGEFVGTPFGEIALAAGGIGVAIQQSIEPAGKAIKAIKGFSTTLSTLSNVQLAMGGIGVALALVGVMWLSYQNALKEAKERQEEMNDKLIAANDPTATLAAAYDKLAKSTEKVKEANEDTVDSIQGIAQAEIASVVGTEKLGPLLDRLGLTLDDVTATAVKGGPAFGDLKQRILEATEGQNSMIGEGVKLTRVLDQQNDAVEDNIDKWAGQIRSGVEVAISNGTIERSVWDRLVAEAAGNTEAERTVAAAQTAADTLPKMADALKGVTVATDAAAEGATGAAEAFSLSGFASSENAAALKKLQEAGAEVAIAEGVGLEAGMALAAVRERQEKATDDQKDATDELADAYDAAKDAQDRWMGVTFGFQETMDGAITQTRDFTKTLGENAATMGEGSAAFEGNTTAAINNRAALSDTVGAAADVIGTFAEMTDSTTGLKLSSEQARIKQEELAQSLYDEAVAAGAPIATAETLKARILEIPTSVSTQVDVKTAGIAEANAELDAIPDELFVRITATTVFQGMTPAEAAEAVRGGVLGMAAPTVEGPGDLGAVPLAAGAFVKRTAGGTLAWVGEGRYDEAVVPLPPGLLEGLQTIARGATDRPGDVNLTVNVADPTGDEVAARRYGRVVGETAAQVISERRLALAMRVGG